MNSNVYSYDKYVGIRTLIAQLLVETKISLKHNTKNHLISWKLKNESFLFKKLIEIKVFYIEESDALQLIRLHYETKYKQGIYVEIEISTDSHIRSFDLSGYDLKDFKKWEM